MIYGKWHPKDSAAQKKARLMMDGFDFYTVEIHDGTLHRGDIDSLVIGERLGNTARRIGLEDGSVFISHDNDAIDKIFKARKKTNGFIHHLETRTTWILTALAVTVIFGFSFFKWGIPWTSQVIAQSLPYETNNLISKGSMKFLDKYMLKKSKLSKEVQDKVSQHFYEKLSKISIEDEDKIIYKLHFRSWEMDGKDIPNALALPSGDIVVTDKFIGLAKNQDEIDAVLLHEMGHVVHRHGLEMMIEGTFVTVAVMMITGDGSGMGDMGVGLGSALVSSSYSRGHESEADEYAFKKMLAAKIDPASFSHVMNRMTAYMTKDSNLSKKPKDKKFMDYFSSHPSTEKRVEIANRYSECFQEGLTVCN